MFFEYAGGIKKNDSIAVHVRRGDYLLPKNKNKFVQNRLYYESAVAKIIRKASMNKPQIIIFSDDARWCIKTLKYICGHQTVIFNKSGVTDTEQMILMSLCTHNVISNSTFSWWSAFLNKNQNKIIVSPRSWSKDNTEQRKAEGLIMPEWIVV